MILKLLNYISSKRNLAFMLLLIPMVIGFSFTIKRLTAHPRSSYHYVDITFQAPAKMALDLEGLVAKKVEKTLNSLQGLISFETITHHEKVNANLMFDQSMTEDKIHLFLQEKLDVLRIQLASSVSDIAIDFVKPPREAAFTLLIGDVALTPEQWKKWDAVYLNIGQIIPAGTHQKMVRIEPDLTSLVKFGMSLDQLTAALRLSGLSYELGVKGGKSYFLEGRREDAEDLKQTIVGASHQRIIKLKDVADVSNVSRQLPSSFSVYPTALLNDSEVDKIKRELIDIFGEKSLQDHRLGNLLAILWTHLAEMIFIVLVFAIIFYIIFQHYMASATVIIFSLFFAGQFLFWTGINDNEISPLHFEAINLSLIMGLFMWGIFLARIRSYFLPQKLDVFIQRNLGQAILFTLVELLPTLLTAMVLFFIFSLPLLMGSFSPVSKTILLDVIFLSFPVHLALLLILSLFTPLDWVKKSKTTGRILPNKLKTELSLKLIFPFLLLLAAAPWIIENVKYSIGRHSDDQNREWSDYIRGYGPKVTYFIKNSLPHPLYQVIKETKYRPVLEWWITPNGLHQLEGRKLISFQKSLEDFSLASRVSNLSTGEPVVVSFAPDMQAVDFGHLLIAGEDKKSPIYLKQIARPVHQSREESIVRSQMDRRVLVVRKDASEFPVLKNRKLEMSALTVRLDNEYQAYKRNAWTVALFSFIILSLYFNSFVRGLMALIFSQAFLLLPFTCAWAAKIPLPVDSLHLTMLVSWFPMVLMLFLSRLIDIERLRGNDKNSSLAVISDHSHPVYLILSLGLLICFFGWPLIPQFGVSKLAQASTAMAGFYSGMTLLTLFLFFTFGFALFYVSTEGYIERLIIYFAKFFYRFRSRNK